MNNWLRLIYDVCRLFLGLAFLTSGIAKFYGESGMMGPGWLFEKLEPYGLRPYAVFIAISELVVGYLLLVRRFATLGAVMLFPILLNIIVLVTILNWKGTPYVVSVFLIMNGYLLSYDFHKLKFLISEDAVQLRRLPIVRHSWRLDIAYGVGLLVLLVHVYEKSLGEVRYTRGAQFVVYTYMIGLSCWVWWKDYQTRQPKSVSQSEHSKTVD
jgi:uncharacterized membrane protein YphA (DoxX/SURF4 family)